MNKIELTKVVLPFFQLNFLEQNSSAEYWVSLGAPRDKLVIGMPTYGHCSILTNSAVSYGVGAPISGACAAGTYSGAAGLYSYYEVKFQQFYVTSMMI
jgi:hypothetical protein